MKTCINHPDKEAISICHNCGKDYCELCLVEGKEYYYCKEDKCQFIFNKEMTTTSGLEKIICPNCESELELSEEERNTRKIHCPECEVFIDFTISPPQIIAKENYVSLLSSLNQGDIALIKSILDNGEIDYYVLGENFLGVDPLIVPARFYVIADDVETAKLLLKDFDLHIFGASDNQY